MINTLKEKKIKKLACGGKFCIALGTDILFNAKLSDKSRVSTPNISKRKNLEEIKNKNLNIDFDSVNRSYGHLKRNHETSFESFKKNLRAEEDLSKELVKYKNEIEKCKQKKNLAEKENRDMSFYLKDLNEKNQEMEGKIRKYKEKVKKFKKTVEDYKKIRAYDNSQIEANYLNEITLLQESLRREQ